MMKFTEKQQAFIANKASGVSNRDAAMAAGYSMASADVRAAELMRRPEVKAAIRAAKTGPGVDAKSTMPRKHYDDPKTFLQDVMNNAQLPIGMRVEAAKQLLPYEHARMGEIGKKEKAKESARAIASNARHRFAPTKSPPNMHVIVGGRED